MKPQKSRGFNALSLVLFLFFVVALWFVIQAFPSSMPEGLRTGFYAFIVGGLLIFTGLAINSAVH